MIEVNTTSCTGGVGSVGGSGSVAGGVISRVDGAVICRLDAAKKWADATRLIADEALANLTGIDLPDINISFPTEPDLGSVPTLTPSSEPDYALPTVTPELTTFTPTANVDDMVSPMPVLPVFGTPLAPSLPPDPSLEMWTPRPTIASDVTNERGDASIETPPVIEVPEDIDLLAVNLPTFTPVTLPEFVFDLEDVTFNGDEVSVLSTIQPYSSAFLDALITRTLEMLNGVGFSEFAQDQAADMVAAKDIQTARAEIRKAEEAVAARGFEAPPGMLIEMVSDIELSVVGSRQAASAKARDTAVGIFQGSQKAALQAQLVIEKALSQVWLEEVRQKVEAERTKLKSAMLLYNAAIDLYNARQRARALYSTTFMARIDAWKKVVKASLLQMAGAEVATTNNKALIAMYSGQVKLMKTEADLYNTHVKGLVLAVEEYKGYLQGVLAKNDIELANMQAYKEEVQAYAAAVEASTSYVDGITAYYRASESMLQVDEANARAASAYTDGAGKVISAYRSGINSKIDVLNANLQTFKTAGNVTESYYRAKTSEVKAAVSMINDHVQAYTAGVEAVIQNNRAILEHTNATNSYALSAEENAVNAQVLDAVREAEQARIDTAIAGARALLASAIAQTTMSSVNVSAFAGASGSLSDSGTESHSYSESVNGGNSFSQTTSREIKSS